MKDPSRSECSCHCHDAESTVFSDTEAARHRVYDDEPFDLKGDLKYGLKHGGHGRVTFSSSDEVTAWHDYPSIFTRESMLFARLFSYQPFHEDKDPCNQLKGLQRLNFRPHLHFKLVDVTPVAFEAFLRALSPRLDEMFTLEELQNILILSTKWEFPNLRKYACKHIPSHPMAPLDKIELARRADVPEWLFAPQLELARRLSALTAEEGRRLGPNSVLRITKAREIIMRVRLSSTVGPRPPMVLGHVGWLHTGCWTVLCNAWNLVMTKDKYAVHELPERAILLALVDLKEPLGWTRVRRNSPELAAHLGDNTGRFTPGRLCVSCDKEELVVEWVKKQDEKALTELWSQVTWVIPARRTVF